MPAHTCPVHRSSSGLVLGRGADRGSQEVEEVPGLGGDVVGWAAWLMPARQTMGIAENALVIQRC